MFLDIQLHGQYIVKEFNEMLALKKRKDKIRRTVTEERNTKK